jgi:transposase
MKKLVSDELWRLVEPLLPQHERSPKGGRPRVDDRAALTGIVFVLKTGIPWNALPTEMGCGSGPTCWRRLQEWQQAGVWNALHQRLLEQLAAADRIDWSRTAVDARSLAAKKGGRAPARTRPIGAARARNTTSSSTATACR